MQKFHKAVNLKQTAQNQPIPGRGEMIRNRAGGYNFPIEDRSFLLRFLVTGAGAGTYKVGNAPELVSSLNRLITIVAKNGMAVLDEVVRFSTEGRGPSNDPALYVLALCSGAGEEVSRKALHPNIFTQVVRTGTHLFTFLEYAKTVRGWGRGFRKAISSWYTSKNIEQLTYQVLKYRQRNGWSHRDVLRKAHPETRNSHVSNLFRYVVDQRKTESVVHQTCETNGQVWAFEAAQRATTPKVAVDLIKNHNIPWEFLPTELLGHASVWEALLPKMNMMAMVRNLGRMTSLGVIDHRNAAAKLVADKLGNAEALKRSMIHPFAILNAFATYKSGNGVKGGLTWSPSDVIMDALDNAFYRTFGNVTPSGKRTMISMDVSGSMDWNYLSSNPALNCRMGAMAMAMITAASEPKTHINAFCSEIQEVGVSPMNSMYENIKLVNDLRFGATDCAAPMLHALKKGLEIDTFVIYTDNETWAGRHGHPSQVLARYRQETGINAKLVSVAMTTNMSNTIADPRDPGMLDIIGFDTATPNAISLFSQG